VRLQQFDKAGIRSQARRPGHSGIDATSVAEIGSAGLGDTERAAASRRPFSASITIAIAQPLSHRKNAFGPRKYHNLNDGVR
jgi:hypothetical protein